MSVQIAFTTIYLFISAILLIYFASYLIQKKNHHTSGLFLLFSFSTIIYLFGYAMELNAHSSQEAIFWDKFEYIGIPFIFVLWIFFILQYMNKYNQLEKQSKYFLLIPPFATLFLRYTNRFHHLFYTDQTFVQTSISGVLVIEYGPFYYLQSVYNVILFIYITKVLISGIKESDHERKKSYKIIMLITSVSMLGYIFNLFFSKQTGLDFVALVMTVSIFLFALPFSRRKNLDSQEEGHVPQMLEMVRQVAYRKSLESALLFSLQKGVVGSESTFFKDSVQYLSQALDMDYVSLYRIEDDKACTPLAAINNGIFTDQIFQFDLHLNKSCFETNKPALFYRRNVQKVYPNNKLLKDLNAESIVHISLCNPGEKPSAVLTFISKKPKANVKMIKMTADIIGNRITAEIARMKNEKIIQESEEKYRFLVTKMNQGLAVFDCILENGLYTYIFYDVNPAFEELTYMKKNQLIGKNLYDVFPYIYQNGKEYLEESSIELYSRHLEMYIEKYDIYIDILCYYPKPDKVAVIVSDITERKKREAEIIYASNHDAVTKLYNRAYFESVKQTLNVPENLPLSVVIGDVNGLKLTNDIFGHDEGDRLLIQTAKILRSHSKEDDIVARIGGDEFAILLKNTDQDQGKLFCENIYEDLNGYDQGNPSGSINPNISLGYDTIYSENESIEAAILNAEANMYRQKLYNKKKNLNELMSNIKSIMFEKTCETPEHIERLTRLSKKLGSALQLSKEELLSLELVTIFHDIGKMKVKNDILSKVEPLTNMERTELQKYPEAGYRIALATPDLLPVADYILCIHERWDGTGYPNHLSGEDIPLISRIFSIVNSYEAMTQDRPYRKALSREKALEEIKNNKGTCFDPCITDVFLQLQHTAYVAAQ
ncbi:MAG TPA: hypothetical protein DDZ89_10190 [Clostridiales bacterium]|nr:hypothetical protein [Clostridiales bacterium]